jgi:hypothetical protein
MLESGKPVDPPAIDDKEFYIAFESIKTSCGVILKGLKITIEEDVIMPSEEVRIDLTRHPLFPKLLEYVKANCKE